MSDRVIAIEEHFQTKELSSKFQGLDLMPNPKWQRGLDDLGDLRISEMDEAGVDLQIISHCAPGTQMLPADQAVYLAKHANDALQAAIERHPTRFAGFAELPTPSPEAAAEELERTVKDYGFKGATINGLTHGSFIDDPRFHVILGRAESLGVPLYLHPSTPHRNVVETYYHGIPALARAGWGFGLEASTQAVRLIVTGTLDKFPKLKLILGHLGEGIPFWLWRSDRVLTRDVQLPKPFRQYFQEHFYITTSGHFSHPALNCCIEEVGIEKILFAVDWPMQTNKEAVNFIREAKVSEKSKSEIFSGNAERLFNL